MSSQQPPDSSPHALTPGDLPEDDQCAEIQTESNEEMLTLALQQIPASTSSLAVCADGHEGAEGKAGTGSGLSAAWQAEGSFLPWWCWAVRTA